MGDRRRSLARHVSQTGDIEGQPGDEQFRPARGVAGPAFFVTRIVTYRERIRRFAGTTHVVERRSLPRRIEHGEHRWLGYWQVLIHGAGFAPPGPSTLHT